MDQRASTPCNTTRPGFHVDPRFTNLRPIGHGGNAVVYAATDSDCDKEVAIKKLSFLDRRGCKYALRELRLMRSLQHENVVTVYEVLGCNGFSLEKGGYINFNTNETSSVYLVQELLHTNLHQLIQQQQLTAEHVQLFTYQLLRGLKYIHSANVLHRDLKPMNLLINVEDLVLKIADFGLARVVDEEYCHKGFLTDNVGTCWYRSPELILSPRDYTKAIDLWSVGCILAEMLTGRPLFPGAHEMDQIGLVLDTVYLSDNEWNKVTQILPHSMIQRHSRIPKKPLTQMFTSIDIDALDLLEKLLVFEPSLRLSAEEALSHPYLQQFGCVEDEPIVLTPFHIEHEVDDLSPKTARKMISKEMSKSIETCGVKIQVNSHTSQSKSEEKSRDRESSHTPACQASPRLSPVSSNSNLHSRKLETKSNNEQDLQNENLENKTENAVRGKRIEDFMNSRNARFDLDSLSNEEGRQDENRNLHDGFLSSDIDLISRQFNKSLALRNEKRKLTVVVDLPDEENLKEQISPKENEGDKDAGTEKSKYEKDLKNASAEKLQVQIGTQVPNARPVVPKSKDIMNEELRQESPRDTGDVDIIDFIRSEKERMRQLGLMERFKNRREKKKRRNRRNNRANSNDDGQDFDSLYRLPTEHLTRHRNSVCSGKDRGVRRVEDQLRLHEELNERRKMAELEKEHYVGAVGGYIEVDESFVHEPSHGLEGGNASPTSEHSRDSSPTNEDANVRRFER